MIEKAVSIFLVEKPAIIKEMISKANPHSTLLRAAKTCLPTSSPTGKVKDGAVNLTGASRKLIAVTKPNQTKAIMKE